MLFFHVVIADVITSICLQQLVRHFPLTKYIWTNLENTVLTVSKFLRVFEVQFSLEGSSERLKEQNAYHAFVSYVREVAGKTSNVFFAMIICILKLSRY